MLSGLSLTLVLGLFLLELDELEVVFGDDEARADQADAVRLELAHRILERLSRVVFVLGDVSARRRAGTESHVGLPHGRGIVTELPASAKSTMSGVRPRT